MLIPGRNTHGRTANEEQWKGWDWLNLNGPWQFRFDGDRVGEEGTLVSSPAGRFGANKSSSRFRWESLAAWGEGDAAGNDNYYSTRVFRNPLEVNRAESSQPPRVTKWDGIGAKSRFRKTKSGMANASMLTIGAADFFTDVGEWPSTSAITKAVIFRMNSISPTRLETGNDGDQHATFVIRVEDPMDNHEQPVGKQWRWYTTTSGIWQTVWLEPRAPSFH